jgi:hypothetical protein
MSPTVPTFAREQEPASPTEAAHWHGHGSPPGSISRAFSALRRRESELGCGFEEEEMCGARDGEDLHAHFAPDSPLVPATYNPHAHLGSGLDSAHDDDPHAAPATYVRHGMVSGIGAVLLRALRAGLPVWERGGDVRLLGGEFVFEAERWVSGYFLIDSRLLWAYSF